ADHPAELVAPRDRGGFVDERPYRLGGLEERGIAMIDQHLRDHGDDVAPDVTRAELVEESALQEVAEAALRLRDQDVERHGRKLIARELGAAKERADLGPVAVGDDDVVAAIDERHELRAHLATAARGLLVGALLPRFHEGVTAHRDN